MKYSKLIFLLLLYSIAINGGNKKVLFIGDSITDGGWGRSGGSALSSDKRNKSDQNHIYGSGFMYLIASYYQSEYPDKEYVFYNRGISGNTLSDLDERWKQDAIDIRPDLISVLIGTNDINEFIKNGNGQEFDFVGWGKKYRTLLDQIIDSNPDIKIVICAPFVSNSGKMKNSTDFHLRDSLLSEFAGILEIIADEYNVTYVPFDIMFDKLAKKHNSLKDSYWIWDGIHPTPAGHKKMADFWIKNVHRVMKSL